MKYSTRVIISRRQQRDSNTFRGHNHLQAKQAWVKSLPVHIQVQFQPNKPNEPENVITKQAHVMTITMHRHLQQIPFRHIANCFEGHR